MPTAAPLALDAPREEVLARAARLVADAWQSFDRFRPKEPPLDERVRALLAAPLPDHGAAVFDALDDVRRILDTSIAQPRPRYFAFIGSSGLEIGVIADALASCFDVNLAVYAAAATEVERQAVRWVVEFVGFPGAAGAFTSGGTISNLTALAAARERALPGSRANGLGRRRPAVYASVEAHYSVKRAVELLGFGARSLRLLPIDRAHRLVPEALERALDEDRAAGATPVAVVASAGTTLTGAVDPLAAVADVCAERGVWLHVDGAYGLPAAATRMRAVDTTLEYSRPFRALKLWLAFRVHGAQAFRTAVERNIRQARLLVCLVNYRTTSGDVRALPAIAREVGRRLAASR